MPGGLEAQWNKLGKAGKLAVIGGGVIGGYLLYRHFFGSGSSSTAATSATPATPVAGDSGSSGGTGATGSTGSTGATGAPGSNGLAEMRKLIHAQTVALNKIINRDTGYRPGKTKPRPKPHPRPTRGAPRPIGPEKPIKRRKAA